MLYKYIMIIRMLEEKNKPIIWNVFKIIFQILTFPFDRS